MKARTLKDPGAGIAERTPPDTPDGQQIPAMLSGVGKSALRFVWRTLFVVVGLPVLYALEPFVRIRMGYVSNQRIGHMAIGVETFLRGLDHHGWPKKTVFVFATWDPANQQLLDMFKRRVRIYQSRFLSHVLFAIADILERTRFNVRVGWKQPDHTPDAVWLLNHGTPALSFTDAERERGRRLLQTMGLGEDDWFVCLNVRDTAFHNHWRPHIADHWTNTKHRNANVENYLKAADYITSLGGYVLRMGAIVEKPLPKTDNPRIIDYATDFRSDFGDIYLSANCRFVLGTNSGIAAVSTISNRPAAFADTSLPWAVPFRSRDLMITRLFRRRADGEMVHFSEIKEASFCQRFFNLELPRRCEELGWELLENDAEDILDLCKDMIESLEGAKTAPEVRALQECHRRRCHDYFGPDSDVGYLAPRFALKYRHLID